MKPLSRLPIILTDYLRHHLETGERVAGKRFLEAGKMYRVVCVGGPYPEVNVEAFHAVDEETNTTACSLSLAEYI